MLASYGGVGLVALAVLASLDLVPISQLVYLAVFYVMAYFMIASIMAAVGSASAIRLVGLTIRCARSPAMRHTGGVAKMLLPGNAEA